MAIFPDDGLLSCPANRGKVSVEGAVGRLAEALALSPLRMTVGGQSGHDDAV